MNIAFLFLWQVSVMVGFLDLISKFSHILEVTPPAAFKAHCLNFDGNVTRLWFMGRIHIFDAHSSTEILRYGKDVYYDISLLDTDKEGESVCLLVTSHPIAQNWGL